jgi:cell division protein FtsZ
LISITGGHDLTLYEVDEAASRIRQEVDEDANIILGATFDSSLEGVVRVSVVATGIDLSAITADDPTSAARMAEAAERMRLQLQQQRPQSAPVIETSAPAYAAAERAPAYPAEAPAYYGEPAPAQMTTHGVYLEPVAARPTYAEPAPEPASRLAVDHAAEPYVPPMPELPRAPRMPTIEDFPKPVQEQMMRHLNAEPQDARRKTSIFERLANFGASRTEAGPQPAAAPQPPAPPRAPAPQPPAVAEYAKRPAGPAPAPAHAALDAQGRRAPQRPAEEDHLEIPAFLRRQANH